MFDVYRTTGRSSCAPDEDFITKLGNTRTRQVSRQNLNKLLSVIFAFCRWNLAVTGTFKTVTITVWIHYDGDDRVFTHNRIWQKLCSRLCPQKVFRWPWHAASDVTSYDLRRDLVCVSLSSYGFDLVYFRTWESCSSNRQRYDVVGSSDSLLESTSDRRHHEVRVKHRVGCTRRRWTASSSTNLDRRNWRQATRQTSTLSPAGRS